MYKIIILIMLLSSISIFGHRDFFVTKKFGNVETTIKTGFQYEEIKKVEIIGKLAEILAKKLNYKEPIFLDFIHSYTKRSKTDYFLSFDNGLKKYDSVLFGKTSFTEKEKSVDKIVIRQVGIKFNINDTLKLIEYSIKNHEEVKKKQKILKYEDVFYSWTAMSIDVNEIRNILKANNSSIVKEVLNTRIERPGIYDDFQVFSYYWKNNKYHIIKNRQFFNEKAKEIKTESKALSIDDIYDFRVVGYSLFVFDTYKSFYVLPLYKEVNIPKRMNIKNTNEDSTGLYEIRHIGNDKYALFLRKSIGSVVTLLYLADKKVLIQDLDKFIDIGLYK